MRRAGLVLVGVGVLGCAKPEPDAAPIDQAPAAVLAPELEEHEYIDPLEAARAKQAARPGDDSWREGFDHRASASDGADEQTEPSRGGAERGVASGPAVEVQPAAPATEPPSFSEPLPALEGARAKSEAERHPPDAQPPLRR